MRFFWDQVNEAEIEAHEVSRETAEAVFSSEDFGFAPNPERPNRWTAEGTVEGKLYRVPFSKVFPDGIRITTAFQISHKRRRT
jgi:uncharacterized DUF497 family protein